MQGFHISPRVGGWDCHGLPVEIEVEKQLGLNSKEEIEAYGVEKFNQLCRESVFRYIHDWIGMSERVGMLLDMNIEESPPNGAYVTMTTDYIESVWWSLAELFNKGLLFRGHKIVPYCPRCGTSLSSHEVAQGYKETKDPSIYVKFDLKNSKRKILAWTTTPWTLISNMLLVVKAKADYVVVKDENGDELILAENLASSVTPKAVVIEKIKGKDLVGLEYESLLPYATKVEGKKHFVTQAAFATVKDGTGIVHVAPAFGEDDYALSKELGVPMFNPVDDEGKFTAEIDAYAGQFVKDADIQIMKDLRQAGKLYKKTTITHTYPFCWRCDHPLLYYAHDSWFIAMSTLRKELMANNEQIYWKPEHLKTGRFGNFIDEAKDWALSRSRYWGTPLPIWRCTDCDHEFAIGSIVELKKHVKDNKLPDDLDLHKPHIDNLTVLCPACGGKTVREPYVIDAWYDSGSAYFAQWHYPFENKDLFEKHFPTDFITESTDQLRGWFYTLHATSTALFNKPSYFNCLTMGHILAEDGMKMSKSRGNSVTPDEAFSIYGADAMRFYLCSMQVWKSTRFGVNLVRDSFKSFLLVLQNVVSFYQTYTKLDNWVYNVNDVLPVEQRPELDKYAISALQSVIADSAQHMDNLEVHKKANSIRYYVNELISNWWIRLSRRRFWDKQDPTHEAAYQTLFEVLEIITKLLAPIIPFTSEYLYQEIILPAFSDYPVSVHLHDYPKPNTDYDYKELETSMTVARQIVSAGRLVRTQTNIKNRQPLSEADVIIPNLELLNQIRSQETLLKEELNVKKINFLQSAGELQHYNLLPNFKNLGRKFRKESKNVAQLIKALDEQQAQVFAEAVIKKSEKIKLGEYELTSDDIQLKLATKAGYEAAEFENGLVFLNIDLSDVSLKYEGIARDVIRRIQTSRSEMQLPYDATITTNISSTSKTLLQATKEFRSLIKQETLTNTLEINSNTLEKSTKWDFTAFGEKIEFELLIIQ